MDYNNTTEFQRADFALSVITGVIGTLGLPGDWFLAILILSDYKKRKAHEWLLFLMATIDSGACFVDGFMQPIFIPYPESIGCKFTGALHYIFGATSLYTPPLVSYNRYLSLYDHQRHATVFTVPKTFALYASIFALCFSWVLIFIASGNVGNDDVGMCGIRVNTPFLAGSCFAAGVGATVAYVLTVYFSRKVIEKIQNHQKNVGANSQFYSRLINESREIILVVILISIVPAFAQMPTVICKMLQCFLPPLNVWLTRLLTAPFVSTSAANGYITLYLVRDYRKATKKFFLNVAHKFGIKPATVTPAAHIHIAPIQIAAAV